MLLRPQLEPRLPEGVPYDEVADLLVASSQGLLSDPLSVLERLKPALAQPPPQTLENPTRVQSLLRRRFNRLENQCEC